MMGTMTHSADQVSGAAHPVSVVHLKGVFLLLFDGLGEQANLCDSWCGKGKDYCSAPDCQMNYGPGCDAVSMFTNHFLDATNQVSRTKSPAAQTPQELPGPS